MTITRRLIVALEIETDLHLTLLKNRWGWKCCDKFVKVHKIITQPMKRTTKK